MTFVRTIPRLMLVVSALLALATPAGADPYPFAIGAVSGVSADVVLEDSGGNGGAFAAHVYVDDGNLGVVDAGEIRAASGGDGLRVLFADGVFYLYNLVERPGECHACAKHFAMTRYIFANHKLVAGVPITIDTSTFSANAPFAKTLLARWHSAHGHEGFVTSPP